MESSSSRINRDCTCDSEVACTLHVAYLGCEVFSLENGFTETVREINSQLLEVRSDCENNRKSHMSAKLDTIDQTLVKIFRLHSQQSIEFLRVLRTSRVQETTLGLYDEQLRALSNQLEKIKEVLRPNV